MYIKYICMCACAILIGKERDCNVTKTLCRTICASVMK